MMSAQTPKATEAKSAADQRVARVLKGPQIFESALASIGATTPSASELTDDELLEQAYAQKMAERGTAL